jgi:hypothetical protein
VAVVVRKKVRLLVRRAALAAAVDTQHLFLLLVEQVHSHPNLEILGHTVLAITALSAQAGILLPPAPMLAVAVVARALLE